MTRISQREARRLRKQVAELHNELDLQRRAWGCEWPGGTNIARLQTHDKAMAAVETARKLGHGVVATVGSDGYLYLHALPLPRVR